MTVSIGSQFISSTLFSFQRTFRSEIGLYHEESGTFQVLQLCILDLQKRHFNSSPGNG